MPATAADSPPLSELYRSTKTDQRSARAISAATRAVTDDIASANNAGIVPALPCAGLDGFTCNTYLLQYWLEKSSIVFTLVLHIPQLCYGLTRRTCLFQGNVFWYTIESTDLLNGLRKTNTSDHMKEVVHAWDELQRLKDTYLERKDGREHLPTGRDILDNSWPADDDDMSASDEAEE